MRRVAVVSRAGGGGGGRRGVGGRGGGCGGGGCGGGGCFHVTVGMKGLHAHEHMSAHRLMHGQCWLQMQAKSIWRATMSIPANMNLLDESL